LGMCFLNTPANTAKLSIAGGNFISAQPLGVLDGVDMQRTGQVRKIDSEQIKRCLANNQIVLISPVGHSLAGVSYNLTLPETSAAVASALNAEKLVFLCRADGILDEQGAVIPDLSIKDALQYCQKNPQHEDIMRSFQAAQTALKNGVSRVQMINGFENGALLKELFTRTGCGTALANNSLTQIRPAEMRDIPDIMRLIDPLVQRGNLLPRTKDEIEKHLAEFAVAEHDRLVYGCAALKSFANDQAGEIYCLAVSEKGRGMGYGDLLLEYIENISVKQGITQLFALTTRTADWFVERGFCESHLDNLPTIRRKQYIENKRNSKIFVKQPKSSPFQAA
ncbi:MAG: amino-acid N-acetyltransferase, partial [Neisseriaceae bacterium]|nr:amino-acid N-acetyltransferase [Neisseriaceae bacterium]